MSTQPDLGSSSELRIKEHPVLDPLPEPSLRFSSPRGRR